MSDGKNKLREREIAPATAAESSARPLAAPDAPTHVTGKQWRGQRHFPIVSPAQLQAAADTQKQYNKPGAVPLSTYLATRGIRDAVAVAAMHAYTTVRSATIEDWATIFANY